MGHYNYGYWALFILVFVEGFGIPAPGQTIIIASAMLAKQGGMDIKWVLLLAWMAAFIGDNIGYLIGRWGGKAVLLKLSIKPVQLIRMEGFFLKYGAGGALHQRLKAAQRRRCRQHGHALEKVCFLQPRWCRPLGRRVGRKQLLFKRLYGAAD